MVIFVVYKVCDTLKFYFLLPINFNKNVQHVSGQSQTQTQTKYSVFSLLIVIIIIIDYLLLFFPFFIRFTKPTCKRCYTLCLQLALSYADHIHKKGHSSRFCACVFVVEHFAIFFFGYDSIQLVPSKCYHMVNASGFLHFSFYVSRSSQAAQLPASIDTFNKLDIISILPSFLSPAYYIYAICASFDWFQGILKIIIEHLTAKHSLK